MNIFWDLDGTLTDPYEGITDAVRYALAQSGITAPPATELSWVIGPALIDTFTELGVPDPQASLEHYRQHYINQGLFKARLYDGVLDMLDVLRSGGHKMYLMTAKPHAYAHKVTAHFGLTPFLDAQFGPELDGTRNDKAELLAHALGELDLGSANNVMIGDRRYDFIAARENAMPSIAALWGYGTDNEHGLAGQTCKKPADIPKLVSYLD